MALTHVDTQTNAGSTSTTTVPFGSVGAGNGLLSLAGVKPSARTRTLPSGFTQLDIKTGGTGGAGADTGQVRLHADWRVADGAEAGDLSYVWSSSANPGMHGLLEYQKSNPGAWSVAAVSGDDPSQSTGPGSISASAASDPGYQAGDVVIVAFACPTDAGTLTNPAITIPGCALSAVSERVKLQTAAGNDGALWVLEAAVESGPSTGPPSFTGDASALNASAGPLIFIRLREPAAGAGSEQTVSPPGIASAEAFGVAAITAGAVTVSPSGILPAAAVGSPVLSAGEVTVSPSGILSGETFGAPAISTGLVTVTTSGIASGETFGTPAVSPGHVTVGPAAIASGEVFGLPVVIRVIQTTVGSMRSRARAGPVMRGRQAAAASMTTHRDGTATMRGRPQ